MSYSFPSVFPYSGMTVTNSRPAARGTGQRKKLSVVKATKSTPDNFEVPLKVFELTSVGNSSAQAQLATEQAGSG